MDTLDRSRGNRPAGGEGEPAPSGSDARRLLAAALACTLVLGAAPLLARAGAGPSATGTVQGTVQSTAGRTLPIYRVQVRDLETGRVAATGTSTADGGFSFAGLPLASYVVEVGRSTGEIVGCNVVTPTTANGIVKTTVSVAAPQAAGAASVSFTSAAPMVARAAVAAGIPAIASPSGRNDPSPSR